MKRTVFLLVLSVIVTTLIFGQDQKSPNYKFLIKRGYVFPGTLKQSQVISQETQWPDSLFYNTVYSATLLGSPTIPISFDRIEFKNGDYSIGSSLSLGYGYTWFLGDLTFNENGKMTIDPSFFFGFFAADIGLKSKFFTSIVTESIVTGVFVGFKAFSLFGGYDYFGKSVTLGLGARIDLYSISTGKLKPFGKVFEVRKHRKDAKPLTEEN
ncbi:MAG: hypothetical protein NTW49_05945 [Bacteroidia bacterium]|nr:hypothetical protein [Bacteroidia bacterium]